MYSLSFPRRGRDLTASRGVVFPHYSRCYWKTIQETQLKYWEVGSMGVFNYMHMHMQTHTSMTVNSDIIISMIMSGYALYKLSLSHRT